MKSVFTKCFAAVVLLLVPVLTRAQNTPPNLNTDIPWSPANFSTVADIQAAFNNARTGENTQLGTALTGMTLPAQSTWNAMSNSDKALWLINQERTVRGLLPFEGVDPNVLSVAQTYANYLLANNIFSHTANGLTPWQRLDANPSINGHHDFLSVAENLYASVTTTNSIPMPVEQAVYGWIYVDSGNAWGHRIACLFSPFVNNHGPANSEGLMAIGRASGGPWSGFGSPWNFAEIIVFNVFDPDGTYNSPLPIQLVSFTGTVTPQNQVRLKWTTASEVNNFGFYVQRKRSSDASFTDVPNGFIPGHGTTNQVQTYIFTDTPAGTDALHYRLRQVDLDGTEHFSDPIEITGVTGVREAAPVEYSLQQNYPNPFNPSTTIRYGIPQAAKVSLSVYNLLDQRVATLANDVQGAGFHTVVWDGRDDKGTQAASGIYFFRLEATPASGGAAFSAMRKMIMLK